MTPDSKPIPQAGTQTPETDRMHRKWVSDDHDDGTYTLRLNADETAELFRDVGRLETERNELRQQLAALKPGPSQSDEEAFARWHNSVDDEDIGMMEAFYAGLDHIKAQLAAATQEAEQAKRTLRSITPSLLNGRGCWTHEEIVEAVASLRAQLTEAQSQLNDAQGEIKYRGDMVDSWRGSYEQTLKKYHDLADQLNLAQAREKKLLETLHYFERLTNAYREKHFDKEIEPGLASIAANMPAAAAALANATPSGAEPTQWDGFQEQLKATQASIHQQTSIPPQ